ncbi:uncharacterized protein ALTATR162_LOCUS4026 [Alternaria atra]|uniref:Heterokaryon incompatibility domain-containing protein n=1 Tax=Alternaria atra TaxID=119953 RepID=A0A8J2I0Q0_9PLEO|nr:uncharacterized protein ALTATR162_LOCUS4026 [Alternaria atra]CAG5156179.1 unnamed protein product [Alternaria atra]
MSESSIESSSLSAKIERLRLCDNIPNESIYEPLPAGEFIRVLKLHPGDTEYDIECSLEVMDIESSKGSYEAISYVWGDANDTVDVHCNGLQVSITVSLGDALRNFRHPSEPRLLWADALCINQENDQEKGHQVKRMGQVYANAKCVLIWLGCDVQNVAEDTFALICEANTYFGDSLRKASNKVSRMEHFTKPYPICVDKDRWSRVARLFKFPWLTRVWDIQEAAIAEEWRIFWGSVSIDIADVVEICVWFWIKPDFRTTIQGIAGRSRHRKASEVNLYFQYNTHRPRSWQQSRVGLSYVATRLNEKKFSTILYASRYLEATDPRDHVYAFLGCPLAKDNEGRTLVEADYTSSLHDINVRLAYALMNDPVEGPSILSTVHHRYREDTPSGDVCPSWVPVWHVAGKDRARMAKEVYWYRAGTSRKFLAVTGSGKGTLTVDGCPFDKVVWRSDAIQVYLTESNYTSLNSVTHESGVFGIDALWDEVFHNATKLELSVRQSDFIRTLYMGSPRQRGAYDIPDQHYQDGVETWRKSFERHL